jgi:hypothetical protein
MRNSARPVTGSMAMSRPGDDGEILSRWLLITPACSQWRWSRRRRPQSSVHRTQSMTSRSSTNLTPKRHPAAFHCHLDAVARNRKIPVERGHYREPCLLVASPLQFVVRLFRRVVAELRNIVGWMLNRNAEKRLLEIMLHLSSQDSGAKRNALKRSGFERPFQARQSRLGRAS